MAMDATMATSAMASTPTRPINRSRRIEMASAAATGMVAALQMRFPDTVQSR